MWYELVVIVIAGLGAGLITGLIGASAVMFVAPLLVIFLGMNGYDAIGISLGIDVFASIVAALWFWKKGNLRIKPGIVLAIFAVIGAFSGSYFSSTIPSPWLITITGAGIIFSGINFTRKKVREEGEELKKALKPHFTKITKFLMYAIAGLIIGIIGGMFGAGGGLSLLLVLTFVSRYRTHAAVGTSVFVMSFLALSGAIGHYIYSSFLINAVILGGIAAIIGSFSASVFANKLSEKNLNKVAGGLFLILGTAMILRALGVFSIWGV